LVELPEQLPEVHVYKTVPESCVKKGKNIFPN
jgi:hypothetical protein